MNPIELLNSDDFGDIPRSEIMLTTADWLEEGGDLLTAEALRWAEERGRWPVAMGEIKWWVLKDWLIEWTADLRINRKAKTRSPVYDNIFEAFQQLGIWLESGFVVRDFKGYPRKKAPV